MFLADCFAAALAKREKAEIYTGDPEFKTAEREIKIVWL
jgi:predicted nucleic acid-binding protein